MAEPNYLSKFRIEAIYTEPYHDRYLHSFKIQAYDEPVGPYTIQIESDIDSKVIDKDENVEANSWVQWFVYINADDPHTINVTITSK